MITCIIRGDLGIQLFQVYTTIAYSIKYNQSFLFYYNSKSSYEFYWKNIFYHVGHLLHDLSIDGAVRFKKIEHTIIQESSDCFSSLIVPINIHKKYVLLDGYFQDKRYFDEEFNSISDLLKIRELQKMIYEKYKSLFFHFENYIYIGIFLQVGVGYNFYDNELKTHINTCNKNICLLLFYHREDSYLLEDTITDLSSHYSKCKIIDINAALKWIDIESWEKMLLLSVCNKIIVASGGFGWWANEYNKYYYSINQPTSK